MVVVCEVSLGRVTDDRGGMAESMMLWFKAITSQPGEVKAVIDGRARALREADPKNGLRTLEQPAVLALRPANAQRASK